MNGKFIVFEGVEGAGKTTQIHQTAAWLGAKFGRDREIIITREPGGTNLGQQIRQLLLGDVNGTIDPRTELLLYAADRAEHIKSKIEPNLAIGNIVLCDRFTDSTIAYQGYGRGFDLDIIEQVNQLATGGLHSDLTIWLDLDVTLGLARVSQRGTLDRMERANIAFHQRVQQGYQELANRYPERIVGIEADRSESAVQQEIQAVLSQVKWTID